MTHRRTAPHATSVLGGRYQHVRCAAMVLAAVFVLSQPTPAFAQKALDADSAAVAAARELMDAAGATKQFDAVVPAIVQQMTGIFVQQQPSYEKTIREAFAGIAVRMGERKDELLVDIAKLYAQQFSVGELQALTRFFTSEIGKRFVEKQLVILPQSMAIGQQWGARIGSEVEAEMRKELRKKGVPI